MYNNETNHEIKLLKEQIKMLEQMVARERALPTIYARSRSEIGLTSYEYKLLYLVRLALRVPMIKKVGRALLRAGQYIKS